MGPIEYLTLFAIVLLLGLVPSSSVALVVTRSASHGLRSGVAASLGIMAGDLVFIALVLVGLSIVAETLGWVFVAVRYLAAAYLFWLGWSLLREPPAVVPASPRSSGSANLLASFLAGLLLTLGDVKAIFFYLSLFPICVDLQTLSALQGFAITAVTLVALGAAKLFYAYSATRIAEKAKALPFGGKARRVGGVALLGAGGYLLVKP